MDVMKNVQINLSIPEHFRNLLRKMAAERVMGDPTEVVTGASIAAELLLATLRETLTQEKNEGENENE